MFKFEALVGHIGRPTSDGRVITALEHDDGPVPVFGQAGNGRSLIGRAQYKETDGEDVTYWLWLHIPDVLVPLVLDSPLRLALSLNTSFIMPTGPGGPLQVSGRVASFDLTDRPAWDDLWIRKVAA
jgi:hypothetical protein